MDMQGPSLDHAHKTSNPRPDPALTDSDPTMLLGFDAIGNS